MEFASLADVLHMDGHGFYVWLSYGVTVLALVTLVVIPLMARRRLLRDIAGRTRRDAARGRSRQPSDSAVEE
ncbi:MAG: heme exporter protein CcmD [Gammaproteobacteria bacterium]